MTSMGKKAKRKNGAHCIRGDQREEEEPSERGAVIQFILRRDVFFLPSRASERHLFVLSAVRKNYRIHWKESNIDDDSESDEGRVGCGRGRGLENN